MQGKINLIREGAGETMQMAAVEQASRNTSLDRNRKIEEIIATIDKMQTYRCSKLNTREAHP